MHSKETIYNAIKSKCPDIDDDLIKVHVDRLDDSYFSYYSNSNAVCEHLRALQKIIAGTPFIFTCDFENHGKISCTIISFDYPALFSLITGILSGMGIQIVSGVIFTYSDDTGTDSIQSFRKKNRKRAQQVNLYRKKIIDHFDGYLEINLPPTLWLEETNKILKEIFTLLENGSEEASLYAKKLVNELVVRKLSELSAKKHDLLLPIETQINNDNIKYTSLKVLSIDTPFFLYAFSTALSLKGILIEYVNIKTIDLQIEDEFHIVDVYCNKIIDPEKLNIIKFTVLLSKQFTYFLESSPDPYTALSRFELLVEEIVKLPEQGRWIEMLSNPDLMNNLARILGTSDQLWEDFIRLQYESIIPMLKSPGDIKKYIQPGDKLTLSSRAMLEMRKTRDEFIHKLNQFKDREIFLLDLDHILNPEFDFRSFSEKLTALAEAVINTASEYAYLNLESQHGTPRSIAGLKAKYSILGLGKFGGAALGYASDIEVLIVFSDNGKTDSAAPIPNAEFFDRMVQEVIKIVKSKREGIFKIDIRLRPYGNKGPLASSLDSFCRYYGPGGDAYSYERLALVRMRAIGGDPDFGSLLERLRDEFIYMSDSIDTGKIFELRKRQYAEKAMPGRVNAKFSPGALVDLEYAVQLLQVIHGKLHTSLRTPRIHKALDELARHGVLDETESNYLISDYDFLRKLINGLRILRGSANDLFLPELHNIEYAHLARRMGYEKKGELPPERQLHIDFETHTAQIRLFVERYFGRESLPGKNISGIADLILSSSVPEHEQHNILSYYGFKNTDRAMSNFRRLVSKTDRTQLFSMLAVLACDILQQKPDPDMALNNWERFLDVLDNPEKHYETMLSQPLELDILLTIFSVSQFLSDTLIHDPQFLDWVIIPENLYKTLAKQDLSHELLAIASHCLSHEEWLNELRRIRRREFLRIGTRDIYLGMPIHETVHDLSICAEAFIQTVMEKAWRELPQNGGCTIDINKHFCILALGKLGGGELNYSSDIDIIGVYSNSGLGPDNENRACDSSLFIQLMKQVRHDLATHTEEGYAYRVDLRLRPYGSSGALVESLDALKNYYRESSSLWEIQSLIKARPVAGNCMLGDELLNTIWPHMRNKFNKNDITNTIRDLRKKTIASNIKNGDGSIDIKNGEGGIRDIEFLVQGLQLIHAARHPDIIHGNTLKSLEILKSKNILPAHVAGDLAQDYIFLRRVEHFLQLFEDRQIHTLPKNNDQLMILARHFLGKEATISRFNENIAACRKRVRYTYNQYIS
jgi:glutamate-ammonia-ligase adenylyltransferase